MSFDRFVGSLRSAPLVEVAEHWNAARGRRLMPSWRDIDPAALRNHLSIIWAWRFDAVRATLVGRLAGETIAAALGMQIRGRPIEECFPVGSMPVIRSWLLHVMEGPRLMRNTGAVYLNSGKRGTGERISLPLSDGGERCDGIVGATVYSIDPPLRRHERLERDVAEETAEFFDLSG